MNDREHITQLNTTLRNQIINEQHLASAYRQRSVIVCHMCHNSAEPHIIYHLLDDNTYICDYCQYETNLDYLAAEIDKLIQIRHTATANNFRLLKLLIYYQKTITLVGNEFVKNLHAQVYQQLMSKNSQPMPTIQSDHQNPLINTEIQLRPLDPALRYKCEPCKYASDRPYCYRLHLNSKKHKKIVHNVIVERKQRIFKPKEIVPKIYVQAISIKPKNVPLDSAQILNLFANEPKRIKVDDIQIIPDVPRPCFIDNYNPLVNLPSTMPIHTPPHTPIPNVVVAEPEELQVRMIEPKPVALKPAPRYYGYRKRR